MSAKQRQTLDMQMLANAALLSVKNEQTSPNAQVTLSSTLTKIC